MGRDALIVIAGGGTGGHVMPALAVCEALSDRIPSMRLALWCTQRPIDREVLDTTGGGGEGLPCADLPAGVETQVIPQEVRPFSLRPWHWPAFLRAWNRACRAAEACFQRDRPAFVLGSGGFAAGPPVYVASRMRIPSALLNPDALPGRANRFLARRVERVFAQWDTCLRYLPPGATVEVTGCPVRRQIIRGDRLEGYRLFGLDPGRRTLLVTGASQGSQAINRAVCDLYSLIAARGDWQVLHLSGPADVDAVREAMRRSGVPGRVVGFTPAMGAALAVADLVISRAGASSVAEIAAAGRAAILIPYPHHRDRHQQFNAMHLVRCGGAVVVTQRASHRQTVRALGAAMEPLLGEEGRRSAMAAAARGASRPNAADRIADWIARRIAAP